MRRVLIVSRLFPHPEAPCVGSFVHEQVRALRRLGVDARVLSGRGFPTYLRRPLGVGRRLREYRQAWARLDWTEYDGVPVRYVPHHVGWLARLLRQEDPYRDAIVRGAPRDFDFDLIHAHTALPDGFAALALARLCRKPLVITEHTGPFTELTREPRRRARTLAALSAAARVWCVSEALHTEVCRYFPPAQQAHIRTLANGVDTALFHPPVRWQPDPAAPRLMFVGFLVEIKNLPLLLDAVAQLRRRVPGATLTLVGDGPLRGWVEMRIRALGLDTAVRLVGERSRAEVAALLREECDLLVLPSQCETFGVALIEALACGKPVVATRCGGPESIVTTPELGALCAPNDVPALAACLDATVARLERFDSRQIRAHAVRTYDYSVLARALLAQYQEIGTATPSCGRGAA